MSSALAALLAGSVFAATPATHGSAMLSIPNKTIEQADFQTGLRIELHGPLQLIAGVQLRAARIRVMLSGVYGRYTYFGSTEKIQAVLRSHQVPFTTTGVHS